MFLPCAVGPWTLHLSTYMTNILSNLGDGLQQQIDGSIQILIYSLFCLKH